MGRPLHAARRTVSLPADPASPGRARTLLREALRDAQRLDCLDAAELACTELVTNAVLHAHTTVDVTVVVADEVRVEVRDGNGTLPRRTGHDAQATTGRGLALVAALTDAFGISDVGPDGKTVWFTVGSGGRVRTATDMLAAWASDDWDRAVPDVAADPSAPAGLPVRLLSLPSALWLAARQHHDALLRELALTMTHHPVDEVDLAATDRARALLAAAATAAEEEERRARAARPARDSAEDHGLPRTLRPVDLELSVPVDMGPDFTAMQDTLDVAERLAQDGRLLARPGLPEIVAVRDWACQQVVSQLAGTAPSPWAGTGAMPPAHDRPLRPGVGLDAAEIGTVARSGTCVAAADELNRIVAVSEPLARLLGWSADALVGRRIVALVPHRLREAHVAGFTRHQTTGQARVLGRPLTVPVLRADGTEIVCGLLLEHRPHASGRGVYLAHFSPVGSAAAPEDTGDGRPGGPGRD